MKIFLSFFLFPISLHAVVTCEDPFAALGPSFTLESPSYCGPTEHYRYALVGTSAYLDTVCVDSAKAMNLYDSSIILYSNPVSGSSWGTQSISASCTGKVQFGIQTGDSNFQDVVTAYTVFDQNSELIGYVAASDDGSNQLTLRSVQNQTILASATRTLIPASHPDCAITRWTVQNPKGLSGAIIAYLLALKDNSNYACTTMSPSPLAASGSTNAIIATVIGTGVLVTGAIFAGFRHYRKHGLKQDLALHLNTIE